MTISTAHYHLARHAIRSARAALESGEGIFALPNACAMLCDAIYHRDIARRARRKVIFLDFDGVLHGRGTHEDPSPYHSGLFLNPNCIARLNRLIEQTGAVVVLSTSWRYRMADNGRLVDLQAALEHAGFRGKIIGTTPDLRPAGSKVGTHTPRSDEIRAWLSMYHTDRFVTLDDHDDADVDGRGIRTDIIRGLIDEHVDAAIRILNTP